MRRRITQEYRLAQRLHWLMNLRGKEESPEAIIEVAMDVACQKQMTILQAMHGLIAGEQQIHRNIAEEEMIRQMEEERKGKP